VIPYLATRCAIPEKISADHKQLEVSWGWPGGWWVVAGGWGAGLVAGWATGWAVAGR